MPVQPQFPSTPKPLTFSSAAIPAVATPPQTPQTPIVNLSLSLSLSLFVHRFLFYLIRFYLFTFQTPVAPPKSFIPPSTGGSISGEPEKTKQKRKKRKKGDEDYTSGEDAPPPSKGAKTPKQNFWSDMEPYFLPFTEEHLKVERRQERRKSIN
jgi:hypothetical protein